MYDAAQCNRASQKSPVTNHISKKRRPVAEQGKMSYGSGPRSR